ncbi:18729_t:CDS:1 [Acaulospora morrowiae]|uniref:18729_t:CDS:1 n=1 Tax=Acaulospora morrowiae TaxID=94023 RepID=A0A9N9HSW2_9GLOM|nr:18729_t:CDS:1 [Acaulospora morrowiae]
MQGKTKLETKFDDMLSTPIEKLLTNLSIVSSSSKITPVVLITTGSMNPIHIQHVEMFKIAKERLEMALPDHKVVAGYISPSQDLYVQNKLYEETITAEHRIEMVRLATQDSSWIDVDTWESKFPTIHFIDYFQVVRRLSEFLNDHEQIKRSLPDKTKIKVMYLCGSDHVIRTGAKGLDEYGLVIIERNFGKKDNIWRNVCERKLDSVYNHSWKEKDFVHFVEGENDTDVSSTKIRSLLRDRNNKWEELCDERVVKYMKDHNILTAE